MLPPADKKANHVRTVFHVPENQPASAHRHHGRKEKIGTMTYIFREYARQCVQLAGRADTPKQLRERLLQMAREYMAEAKSISLRRTDLDHPRSVGNIPQTQNIET